MKTRKFILGTHQYPKFELDSVIICHRRSMFL